MTLRLVLSPDEKATMPDLFEDGGFDASGISSSLTVWLDPGEDYAIVLNPEAKIWW